MPKSSKRTPQRQRRLDWERDYRDAKVVVKARSGGRCEFPDCISRSGAGAHHKLQGRVHPRCNEPEFLMDVCPKHHDHIHAHPEESYERGWLLHDWDVPRDAA